MRDSLRTDREEEEENNVIQITFGFNKIKDKNY